MAVKDVLGKIGHGAEEVAKETGTVLGRGAKATGLVLGEGAKDYFGLNQVDPAARQRQWQIEDEQIAIKANELENQLAMGQKYGTLNPQQQEQYVDAISKLYSHPRHAATLMEKLRKITHPKGAYAQDTSAQGVQLTNAMPEGGTAAADEARAEKLWQGRAKATAANRTLNPKVASLENFTETHYGTDFSSATPEQQEAALEAYGNATRAERLKSYIANDPSSPTKFSYVTGDILTGTVVSTLPGAIPPRGFIPTATVTRATDQYGNITTTVSERTPQIPGAQPSAAAPVPQAARPMQPSGGAGGGAPVSTPAAALGGGATPVQQPRPGQPQHQPRRVGGILPKPSTGARPVNRLNVPPVATGISKVPPLDANGHIPLARGLNPQVVEFANELIDNQDVTKIPTKARAAAADLARKYGWEQGALAPKEKILVNEVGASTQQMMNSPSLKVLDSPWARGHIATILKTSQGSGMSGLLELPINLAATGTESKEEAEFIRLYNKLVSTIAGLSPITRGGRPVEAGISRIMQEIPSVLQSRNSEDAKERLKMIQQEINTALQTKGNTPTGGGVGGALGGAIRIQRDAQGNIIGVN